MYLQWLLSSYMLVLWYFSIIALIHGKLIFRLIAIYSSYLLCSNLLLIKKVSSMTRDITEYHNPELHSFLLQHLKKNVLKIDRSRRLSYFEIGNGRFRFFPPHLTQNPSY